MGKPGAKKMDQIVSLTPGDVHIIMVPSPGGPVPTPIPHPVPNSLIKDKVAKKVKVMGQPGAVKGSKSKHTPPHIPMGPGPFQKPPKNEGEIITASSNVLYEGKGAAMLGDTAMMCSDPSDTPVGKVIGKAAMVLVGGGGQGSDAARAAAGKAAMKAAAAACHRWVNANMPPGADREQAHRDICTATGHPVDVATGKMFTRRVDLELPGRIPFAFVRNYSSARSDVGAFGPAWRHSYEVQLLVHREFIAYRDANGRFLEFAPIAVGDSSRNELSDLTIHRHRGEYVVEQGPGRKEHFKYGEEPGRSGTFVPLSRISDPFGNQVELHHTNGKLTRIVDSAGRVISLTYNGRGFIASMSLRDPEARESRLVQSYAYSEEGMLVEARDAAMQSYRYEYDSHLLVRETDRNGFSFYFRYDGEGWCTETWGDGGILHRRLEYDIARARTRMVDSQGHAVVYQWNESGLVEVERDPAGGEWSFEYDPNQRKLAAADPLGNAWSYEYDDAGRLLSRVDPTDAAVGFEYDDSGRMSAQVDALGERWLHEYDERGLLRAKVDPHGGREAYEWSTKGDLAGMTDPIGSRTALRHDASGNPTERTGEGGLRVERRYSLTGKLEEESDSFGPRIRLEYDSLDRVVKEWRRGRGEVQYEYDAEGNVTRVTDPCGSVTRFRYGRFNRVLARLGPEVGDFAQETELEYDSENRLRAISYPGGRVARYEYDEDGRISSKRSADGRTIRYVRNEAGYVTDIHDDEGLIATYELDGMGRVTRRTTSDGEIATFEYDARGRLTCAENADGSVRLAYDGLGQVVEESDPNGCLNHSYDPAGRLSGSTFNDESRCELEWSGQRLSVRGSAGSVELDHDSNQNLIRIGFANGQSEEFRYEGFRRPQLIARDAGVESFTFDANERITRREASDGTVWEFDRDALGRLIGASRNGADGARVSRFAYDMHGNRAPESGGFAFDDGNRLVRTPDEEFIYDRRGRLVERRPRMGDPTTYRYSVDGRLLEARIGERTVEFRYDALGRRIAKVADGKETRFAWEGSRLAHEWRPDGEERHYVYRPDSYAPLMCQRRNAGGAWEALFFENDHRGCPEQVTNIAGEVVWRAVIGPFGEVEAEEGEIDQHLGLPGQYRDVETGLAYNFHRYYAPDLTVYITPDPIGHLGGENLYAYVADPITKIDPLGLNPDDYDGPTPHRIVEIDGVKYVEFEAAKAFTSSSNINVGGSGDKDTGSCDTMASIGPGGTVVVQEGRHRAVAAAAGDVIPEESGGIPGEPGWLRYNLGDEGMFETTNRRGPSLSGLASDPQKLAAARSGKRSP